MMIRFEIPKGITDSNLHSMMSEFHFECGEVINLDTDDAVSHFKKLLEHAIDSKKDFSKQKEKLGING